MSQSVTGRHSDFIAANSFRKLASSRDRFDDPDLNVGYSQLLPSTKYWAPGKLPQYLETNERYDKCPRDEEVENDYSLTTTYDMDHSDNLRASPIRRHSSRTTSAPTRRTRVISKGSSGKDMDENPSDNADMYYSTNVANNSSDADAWRLWLQEKEKQMIADREKKRQETEAEQESEKAKEMEKEKREQLSKLKRQEWLAKKIKDEIEGKLKEERKSARKEKAQIKEKEDKKAKNEERVKEWKEKKIAEEKELKQKMKEAELSERQQNEEKAQKAHEKYQEWVKQANSRPSRVSASLGYTGGRLIGFYDWSSYPSPSYYNPIPWQPLDIPEGKPRKPKATYRPASARSAQTRKPTRPLSSKSSVVNIKTTKAKDNLTEQKESKRTKEILSPPLMWKDVLARKNNKETARDS